MHIVVSTYTVTLDGAGAVVFANAAGNLSSAAIKEPGCRRFDVCDVKHAHGRFLLIQYFETEQAFEAHRKSAHYRKFAGAVAKVVIDQSEETARLAFSPTGP